MRSRGAPAGPQHDDGRGHAGDRQSPRPPSSDRGHGIGAVDRAPGHVEPDLGGGEDSDSWKPTPPSDPEGLDGWAREGMDRWRSDDVVAALRAIVSDTVAPPGQRAVALLWTLPVLEDDAWSAARALVDDPRVDRTTRVRLAALLARVLAGRDDRDAAGALDDAERLAAAADGDPRVELAVARARVEIAAHGRDVGRIRDSVDRLVATSGADDLPGWARDGALATALGGLRRCAAIDAQALQPDQVTAVIDAARSSMAGRRRPAAVAAVVLLDAAALALAVDRADDALSLATGSVECGGDAAPARFRFAAALLSSDAAGAARGPAGALVHQRRAIAVARELGADHAKGMAHRGMGLLLMRLDRYEQADEHLSRATELLIAAGEPSSGAEVSLVRARERLHCDDIDAARHAAQTAITALEPAAARDRQGDPAADAAAGMLCDALGIRNEVDDLDGDHRTAAAGWLQAADLAAATGRCGADHRSAAARSLAWDGQPERARREFERAVHEAESLDGPEEERARQLGSVLERRAAWHLEAGRTGRACDDARESVAALEVAGDGTASAQAGLVLGRALDAAGKPLAAEAAWRSALSAAPASADPASWAVTRAIHAALAQFLAVHDREEEAAQHRRLSVAVSDDTGREAGAPDSEAAARLEAAHAAARRGERASHPDTGAEALAELVADPLAPVRAAVAARPDLPTPLARRLARDGDAAVAAAIAGNPAAPRQAIRRAARPWASAEVRRAAAANPNAGRWLLVWFALSGRWDVRRSVAGNPACPQWLLVGRLALDRRWSVREAVAASPRTSGVVLSLYARDRLAPLRFAVAGNRSLPSRTAERLLRDQDAYVAGVAASHPGLRSTVLSARFGGMEAPAWVLRRAATNPSCPPELAEQVLTWLALGGAHGDPGFDPVTCDGHPGDTDQSAWQWYGAEVKRTEHPWHHPLWAVRARSTLGRQTVQTAVLRHLARDPVPEVRRVVLGFRGLGQPLYHELTGDADQVVRQAAPRLLEEQRKDDRTPAWVAVTQRHRRLRALVIISVWILAVWALPSPDEPERAETAIDRLPEFTVDSEGRVQIARDAVMPAAPRLELDGGGQVTVGHELAAPQALIVRIETDASPIVVHQISWEPAVAESPASDSRVMLEVVGPFDAYDVNVPGRPSTVEVEMTAAGERETHRFEVGSAAAHTEVAP